MPTSALAGYGENAKIELSIQWSRSWDPGLRWNEKFLFSAKIKGLQSSSKLFEESCLREVIFLVLLDFIMYIW